jgi:hypothetical protein
MVRDMFQAVHWLSPEWSMVTDMFQAVRCLSPGRGMPVAS